ncbi:unnamed protein product [Arabis nemorensis]|uniref:Uncharacterized protein n=1 Tax=Arabis nemorensis TaxID=586526 RepID=A0A565ASS8_9BRAS|nr:unnamed protein product [Arabis nemorensis]
MAVTTFFSVITMSAEHLLLPSTLSWSKSYADMSLRGAKNMRRTLKETCLRLLAERKKAIEPILELKSKV